MEERDKLLYIELPNLINRIMKYDSLPTSHVTALKDTGNEIKKISNAEVESAMDTNLKFSLIDCG